MIGVSPAFYISKNTSHFTVQDQIDSMKWLSDNNFNSLQLEVFHYDQLDQWTFNNCVKLKDSLSDNGLQVSQFVAHFLMNCFDSVESIKSDSGLAELEFISVILNNFELTKTITVPVPAFAGATNNRDILDLFDKKLSLIEAIAVKHNLTLALEPQPGSLAADLTYLKRFENIGLNLDPGHISCSGIDPFTLGSDILSKVKATHLCENDGIKNLSLRPGSLEYNWAELINNLFAAGYKGSLDIEIICPVEQVEAEYRSGNFFLSTICIQNNIYSKGVIRV
ncbi:MAG: sugar phosphate isomerase/epimerase [Spirochaetaceae bacterium]